MSGGSEKCLAVFEFLCTSKSLSNKCDVQIDNVEIPKRLSAVLLWKSLIDCACTVIIRLGAFFSKRIDSLS